MSRRSHSLEILERLKGFSTCAIANAIEYLNVRLRNVGFGDSSIHCRFAQFPPVAGYAVTLKLHGANPPMEGGVYVDRTDWWDELAEMPSPHIVVIEDGDHHVGTAAFVGEIHAAILQAMGSVAVITNGSVRDLEQVERLGFQLFSGSVSVSHAYAHVAKVDTPVRVAGLSISPGELLHGDQHGIVKVPLDGIEKVLEIADRLRDREAEILRFCRSDHFSRQGLRNLLHRLA